jgi:hypothetical protein
VEQKRRLDDQRFDKASKEELSGQIGRKQVQIKTHKTTMFEFIARAGTPSKFDWPLSNGVFVRPDGLKRGRKPP